MDIDIKTKWSMVEDWRGLDTLKEWVYRRGGREEEGGDTIGVKVEEFGKIGGLEEEDKVVGEGGI